MVRLRPERRRRARRVREAEVALVAQLRTERRRLRRLMLLLLVLGRRAELRRSEDRGRGTWWRRRHLGVRVRFGRLGGRVRVGVRRELPRDVAARRRATAILRLELADAVFEVADILDAGLQNGKLVHLAGARGYHVLQHAELLVHLAPPPSLDEAVCRLPRDLPARGARRRWRFPLPARRGFGRLVGR